MRRKLVLLAVILTAVLGWWLFGWRSLREDRFTTTAWRFFGRYTRVDTNGSGIRLRHFYRWKEPFRPGVHPMPIPSCFGPHEWWEDTNGDGKWEVWATVAPRGTNGECSRIYGVDLNGDEKPDWSFSAAWMDSTVRDRIRARRGW